MGNGLSGIERFHMTAMTSVALKGHDPNTLRVQYLEKAEDAI